MVDPNINSAKDFKQDKNRFDLKNISMPTTSTNMNDITKSSSKISNQPVGSYNSYSDYNNYNKMNKKNDDEDKEKSIMIRNLIIGALIVVILALVGVYFFYLR